MPPTPEPQVTEAGATALATALREAIAASQPRKKTTYAEAVARNAPPELPAPAYQNSKAVDPHGLSSATIKKLYEIPAGVYLNGLIRVHRRTDTGVELYYDNHSSPDKRVNFMLAVTSFSDMVDKLHKEAAAIAAKK